MLNDWTEIRHAKHDKALWKAAAAACKQTLSAWMRDTLSEKAKEVLGKLSTRA